MTIIPQNHKMDLTDTTLLMASSDYKDRFLAEVAQTKIRREKLENLLNRWDKLDFAPACPYELLRTQYDTMGELYKIYIKRSKIEKISLMSIGVSDEEVNRILEGEI